MNLAVFRYLFLDVEPAQLHKMRRHVKANVEKLLALIRKQFGGSRVSVTQPHFSAFVYPADYAASL